MNKGYLLRCAVRLLLLLALLGSAAACKGVSVHVDLGPTEAKVGTPTILSTLAAPAPTATATEGAAPATATSTETPMPPTPTSTDTPVPPTATLTNTPMPPTATPTATRKPPTPTVTLTPSLTPVPQAEVKFTADKTKIDAGDCTVLRWNVKNANAVYLDGVGVVGAGTKKICPGSTTTYKLHVDAPGGDVDKEITVKVV